MSFWGSISNKFFNNQGNQNQVNKPVQNNQQNEIFGQIADKSYTAGYDCITKYAVPSPTNLPTPSGVYKYAIPDIAPNPAPETPTIVPLPSGVHKYAIPDVAPNPTPNPVLKYAIPTPSGTPESESSNPQPANPWGGNIFKTFFTKIFEFFSKLFQ